MPQAWNTLFCTDPSNHYCWFCHQVPSNSCISWNDHCKDDPNSLAHHLGFKHGWWTTTLLRSNNCLPIPIRSKSQRNGSVSSDEVKGRELIYIYIYMVTYLWYMLHMISFYTLESIIGWMVTKNFGNPKAKHGSPKQQPNFGVQIC